MGNIFIAIKAIFVLHVPRSGVEWEGIQLKSLQDEMTGHSRLYIPKKRNHLRPKISL